jgi:hypothetical protein
MVRLLHLLIQTDVACVVLIIYISSNLNRCFVWKLDCLAGIFQYSKLLTIIISLLSSRYLTLTQFPSNIICNLFFSHMNRKLTSISLNAFVPFVLLLLASRKHGSLINDVN